MAQQKFQSPETFAEPLQVIHEQTPLIRTTHHIETLINSDEPVEEASQVASGEERWNTESESTTIEEYDPDIGYPMDRELVTETILIRHPRSLLVCAIIQLCIGLQIVVFGIVCHFYDGCKYLSSLWMGTIFLANAVCGIILIKSYPKRTFLIFYSCTTLLSLVLSIILFGITAWQLDVQEQQIREQGWSFLNQRLLQANQIMENTKLAMYTLHLLFIPGHALCIMVSLILCGYNLMTAKQEEHEAFYVSNEKKYQTVLVPVSIRSGVKVRKEVDPEYEKFLKKKKSKKTQTTARMRLLPDVD